MKKTCKRITLILRPDLIDRVREKLSVLLQKPNRFVNNCVEDILNAMDSEGEYEIPILELYNTIQQKRAFSRKAIMALCSAITPELAAMNRSEKQFFIDLINQHEGKLTSEIIVGYCELAIKMNLDKVAHEKQLAILLGK